ncbi:DUF1376 domain-containing protein [Bizionia paragorgiae]|uniref:Uncharacterized conserved protein YdaU, DUF1376 family n=1 Tax=Bizionia paragorgiae TaxID=283786 RepID=A0A1H4ATV1_BIZPA|nr:DUF1376 domain-containing protein [Bizionia paragorgiae]SEA39329.1 Uncharacterized conserved protein YdaU, DUF1376 family [Bizionia paragorgiae]
MSKDPAFLFYSTDFYEGTRMMLPEERACYIDLMIYQHQNGGYIPNDLKRVKMYCSGVDEATLQATLQAKFKLCDKGWYNKKLKNVIEERENFSKKQSVNGIVGQFWKRANKELTKTEVKKLKSLTSQTCSNNEDFNTNWLNKIKTPKAMLEAMLKHLENEDEDEIKDINRNKDEVKKEKTKTLNFPFNNSSFLNSWELWKDFKRSEFGFKYKSTISEQAALKKIAELANYNHQEAISIINQSIENGWKGFFKLNTPNGKSTHNDTDKELTINRQTAATIDSNSRGWEVE